MEDLANAFRERRVLITGGLGFIGSNLAHTLVALGARVSLVDSLAPGCGGNERNIAGIEEQVAFMRADLRDGETMAQAVAGQDFVFNLAGQTSHWDSMTDPVADLEANGRAQLLLLEACRKANGGVRIVFASTRQIYGRPAYLPVDEQHPLQPVDVNGVNKLAGEQYHLLYARVHGLRSVVLRLTNTIGPRMRVRDARQTFLGDWIRSALQRAPFEVWGGGQVRDFTYVDDAVEALLIAAVRPEAVGRAFNLGGIGRISLQELAGLLTSLVEGASFRVREFPADRQSIDIGDYYADGGLIARTLGWKPRTGIREALERTVRYYERELAHYLE